MNYHPFVLKHTIWLEFRMILLHLGFVRSDKYADAVVVNDCTFRKEKVINEI